MANAIFQNSFTQRRAEAILGQLAVGAQEPFRGSTGIARGKVKAGYAVFNTAAYGAVARESMIECGDVFQIPSPGIGADVDAIVASRASSASILTLSGTSLDGVVGGAYMSPARLITLVLSSHANWDATTAVLTGLDMYGRTQTENLTIPDAGNATVTSTKYYSKVTSLVIPAQAGTGGSFTVGVAALTLALADVAGVAIRTIKPSSTLNQTFNYPCLSGVVDAVEAEYMDGEPVSLLKMGGIWVYTEEAVVKGQPVYVRVAAGTGTTLGAFRNDADSDTCVALTGARFERSADAGLAWANFPSVG